MISEYITKSYKEKNIIYGSVLDAMKHKTKYEAI